MKRNRIIIIAIIVALIGIGVWYFKFYEQPVEVEQVHTENVVVGKSISGSGTMESDNDVSLAFAASGVIQNINAKKDDIVERGQNLARLNVYSDAQTAQSLKDGRDIAIREKDLFVENYAGDKDATGGEEQYSLKLIQN